MKRTQIAPWLTARSAGVPALILACFCSLSGPARSEESPDAASAAHEDEAVAATDGETAETTNRVAGLYGARPRYSGRLRVSYDYRTQGDDSDSDLYGHLYGSGRNLYAGRMDFYASARLHTDLDKPASASLADDPFRSIDESDGVTEDRVLQLYADLHDRQRRLTFRGGRQYVDIADYLHMDGGQVTLFEERALGGRVYLGHPVSYHSSVSGDLAAGLSLVGRPWAGNRTRLTVARYEDDSEDECDQNYFLDMRQQMNDETRVRSQVSVLNDEFRMGRLDIYYYSEDGETDLSFGGSRWGAFDARTRAYSPLYHVLGEQQPYTYAYARLTRQLVPSFLVSPGVSLRFADGGGNDYNNRDYGNYDLTFIYQPVRAFSASLSMQYWEVEDDDSFMGITGDLRYRHLRLWEIGGGASYAQYTYDTYSDLSYTANGGQTQFTESGTVIEESPYVRTYFLRAKWNVTRRLTLRVQADVEDDDSATDLAYRGRGSVEVRY